jgi:hypothetical protein
MTRRLIVLPLLVILAACQAERPPQPPAEVRAAVVRQLAEVGVDAGQVDKASGLFKPVELTSQAAPDWLVDFNVLPNGQLCGTGGCPLQVWVKIGQSPYTLAFDRQALGHEVARHENGRRWLTVEPHGVLCGGTGSDPCRYHFEWRGEADAPDGHFAAASLWGKPLRYQGPLLQAMPMSAPAGSNVATALDRYRAACAAAGGRAVLDDALARLPDLNRDGRPELLFDAGQADCQHDDLPVTMNCPGETCRSQLFTEAGGQGWRAGWSGEAFAYTVDFSQPDARLLIRPFDCDEQCPEQVMTWRDADRRFVNVSH